MKKAACILLSIGLLSSFVETILGIAGLIKIFTEGNLKANSWGIVVFSLGIYGMVTAIGSFISIDKNSKTAITLWGILYLPVLFLASIFMFGIDPTNNNVEQKANQKAQQIESPKEDRDDIVSQLTKIVEMRSNDLLTDEEFENAKSKILSKEKND